MASTAVCPGPGQPGLVSVIIPTYKRATLVPLVAARVHWGDMFSAIVMGNIGLPSTLMVTRERANRVGPFNEALIVAEDHDYHLRCCREGTVAVLDAPSTRYRVGAGDQLTHPIYGLQFAQNLLVTILPVIQNERARLKLSDKQINQKLAMAYAWLGRELVERGQRGEARKALLKSLRFAPGNSRNWASLTIASLPAAVVTPIRGAYRRAKRTVRPA